MPRTATCSAPPTSSRWVFLSFAFQIRKLRLNKEEARGIDLLWVSHRCNYNSDHHCNSRYYSCSRCCRRFRLIAPLHFPRSVKMSLALTPCYCTLPIQKKKDWTSHKQASATANKRTNKTRSLGHEGVLNYHAKLTLPPLPFPSSFQPTYL